MTTRRTATAGLGLVAALTFALAGCTDTTGSPTVTGTGTPGATGSAAADPAAAAALAQAAAKLSESSFRLTTTSGPASSVTGVMDPPNKLGQTKLTTTVENVTVTIESIMIGEDIYLKISGLPENLSSKWLHVDVQRLSPDSQLGFTPGEFDPAGTERLLKTATDVRRVGEHGFVGTLDLTKATGVASLGEKVVVSLGDEATAVPFEATTDEADRLVAMKINLPAVTGQPTRTIDTRYSDFGAPVTIQKPPASETVEAPDLVYKALGG
ncbi:MAG TPA: hypothetical protein VFR67_14635 [Pilimelia sp.]|nr:hypothetical protein [Pilimelia sp.]